MRILFLDFDGVIAPRMTSSWDHYNFKGRVAKSHIRRAILATNCKVVITSNWRKNCFPDTLSTMLVSSKTVPSHDVIVGETPILTDKNRGDEITEWLSYNPHVESFVILDDKDNAIQRAGRRRHRKCRHGVSLCRHSSCRRSIYVDQRLRDRFVHVNKYVGCSMEDADKIIKLFNESE